MGKARIEGGGAEGLYTITPLYDENLFLAEKAKLERVIDERAEEIERLDDGVSDLETLQETANEALNAAIEHYIEIRYDPEQVDPAMAIYSVAQAKSAEIAKRLADSRRRLDEARAAATSATQRLALIQSVRDVQPRQAWCADMTDDASGTVATIEVPGEVGTIVIRPQQPPDNMPGYIAARDGLLMPREWMSPEQAYFNAAILPGWQRHQPTYRSGTITAIDVDANVCDVALDAAKSSAQDLEINAVASLENVPVSYMTCNAAAFDVGDRVVIEFAGHDWAAPTVIGFLHNPVACIAGRMVWMPEGFWLTPRNSEAPNGWGLPIVDGAPTAGGPITQVIINRQAKNNYPDELFGSRVAPQTL